MGWKAKIFELALLKQYIVFAVARIDGVIPSLRNSIEIEVAHRRNRGIHSGVDLLQQLPVRFGQRETAQMRIIRNAVLLVARAELHKSDGGKRFAVYRGKGPFSRGSVRIAFHRMGGGGHGKQPRSQRTQQFWKHCSTPQPLFVGKEAIGNVMKERSGSRH